MLDSELIEQLKKSKLIIGEQTSIIIDFDGEILSGMHRKEAGWEKSENIDTRVIAEKLSIPMPIAKEIVRLHFNLQRKPSREETQASLLKIAKELELKGIPKENIASEVAKLVPYSHSWVLELLPSDYKQPEKVEAGKISVQVAEQKKEAQIEQPHPIQCACCPNGTLYPKNWQGKLVCPTCYDKLERGEITLEAPKPEAEPTPIGEEAPKPTPPRVEKRVYEPGAWREEMRKPVSRMDEWVAEELSRRGIPIEIQQPICIKFVVPEVTIKKGDKPLAVFLDHPDTHAKRTLADMENRELLAKRGCRVLELQYDAYTEEQRQLIITEILEAIK